jgi:hypothetical protein
MGEGGGCNSRYDSHQWPKGWPKVCERCGLADLRSARLLKDVLKALEKAGIRVYDDR